MIPKLIFNESDNRKHFKGTDEEFKEFCEIFEVYSGFSFDAYQDGVNCFMGCFDGYEDWNQPWIVDYGYGLTSSAIDKYITANYGDTNPSKFLIEVGTMSFDYEKPWKCGSYIDENGVKTYKDYNEIDGIQEKMKNAELKDHFISFGVYDLTNKR